MRYAMLFLTVLLITLSSFVWGQGMTGSISGNIVDPQARAVEGVRLKVTSGTTGATRFAETSVLGEYSIPLLPPGSYAVEVQKEGFRTATFPKVEVRVDNAVRLDVRLDLGVVEESVVVMTAAPIVDATTGKVGHVIDASSVEQLPLNERNFLSFALLVPGVQMPADGSQNIKTSGAFSVNGAREQSNNFLLDGGDNNDPFNNQYSVLPPVEAIQEFKVQATTSSADFGRTGGAQVNIVLKSGGNQLHGSALELLRNRHIDARNYFDRPECRSNSIPGTCAETPGLDRSQFGGSLGGPIRVNRAFFFAAYEGLRLRAANTRQATVPSQTQRDTALAAVPAVQRNAAGLAALNLYPAANTGADLSQSNLFVSSPIANNSEDQGVIKTDFQVAAKDTLAMHYAIFNQNDSEPFNQKFLFTNLPGFGSVAQLRGQSATLRWNRVASYTFANTMLGSMNRRNNWFTQQGSGDNLAAQIGFPTPSSNRLDWGYPNIALSGFDGIGTAVVLPQNLVANTFQFSDDGVWKPGFNSGRHEIHFGGDARRIQENEFLDALSRGQFLFQGAFTGSPIRDLISGLPTVAVSTRGDSHGAFRATQLGLYVTDSIQAGLRLSINAGLRYDLNTPPIEIHDRVSRPDLSSNSLACTPKPDCMFLVGGTNGVPRATYAGTNGSFGPRVGLAWRALGSNALVVRSGYGIYNDVSILNINIFPHGNPPFFYVNTFANRGASTIQTILNPALALPLPPSATMVTPEFRDGYVQQWHLSLEREVENTVLSVRYVGSKGTHLVDQRQGNQASPGGISPYPQFGAIRLLAADGSSIYHSLQLAGERRFANGLGFLSGFTWSRSIDNVSAMFGSAANPGFPQNSSDLRAERGLSEFHAKFRFTWSAIYDLPRNPFGSGSKAAAAGNRLLGGWQASAAVMLQSGRPFTVNRTVDQSRTGITLGTFDRPDVIADPMKPGPVAENPNPACQVTRSHGGLAADVVGDPASWFNPCAFAAPSTVRFGTAGRNILIGPGLANVDFALHKFVKLAESQQLELRLECFNLFNHPNFDLPNRMFDSPTFGVIQSANAYGNKPPRQVQVGVRFVF